MRHRGVTLLELLIVIALLLGAAALVLPHLDDQLAERSFSSIEEQVQAHLLLARAEAMAMGTPLEVRWIPETHELVVFEFDPEIDTAALVDTSEAASSDSDFDASDALPEDLFPLPIEDGVEGGPDAILSLRLPQEYQVLRRQPARLESDAGDADLDDAVPPEQTRARTEDVFRIAVYLGDGSALLARPVWLSDASADGRISKLEINPWSGVPNMERVVRTAGAGAGANDEDRSDEREFTLDSDAWEVE